MLKVNHIGSPLAEHLGKRALRLPGPSAKLRFLPRLRATEDERLQPVHLTALHPPCSLLWGGVQHGHIMPARQRAAQDIGIELTSTSHRVHEAVDDVKNLHLRGLSAASVRSSARSQENHSSASFNAPDPRRPLSSAPSIKVWIAAASASGSRGGHKKTFSPWTKDRSSVLPRVEMIGSPCAAAAANVLLFMLTPSSKGRTHTSAAWRYNDSTSLSQSHWPVQTTSFSTP